VGWITGKLVSGELPQADKDGKRWWMPINMDIFMDVERIFHGYFVCIYFFSGYVMDMFLDMLWICSGYLADILDLRVPKSLGWRGFKIFFFNDLFMI
jgi:hypothetical protein